MRFMGHWIWCGFFAASLMPSIVSAQMSASATNTATSASATTNTATSASAKTETPYLRPWTRLGRNVADSFLGWNMALHLTAFAVTPVLIVTDADMRVHNFWASHQMLEPYSIPGVYLGYALPILTAGSLATYGLVTSSRREAAAASAVVQATVVAVVYQSVLKAFTGRPAPDPYEYTGSTASERFRFGFFRGGIHYGWPSGHMMTTTAVATSLWPIYPDSISLRVGSTLLILGMAASVAVHEHASMHWTSDMVAGTLMGFAIGRGIGRGFAEQLGLTRVGVNDLDLTPIFNTRETGFSLRGTF